MPRDFDMPFVTMIPKFGDLVKDYLLRTDDPTVSIKFQGTQLGTKPASQVADFSSRGPDIRSPWILKPDILAPGVDVLAGWAPNRGSHVVGIAALLKATHRDWSSAAAGFDREIMEADQESSGSSEDIESPRSVVRKWPAYVHSQVLRIREEDSLIGEDVAENVKNHNDC
ncbi:hypothetical protein POM88_030555 [Heracleum sosnowskyi]|uniref:Uncharacterized protein n=1 Tax=Heracleum sosnowskyi TaxID=360622 RepID=A0AAD8HVQ6_9APIA|nr:hypothetical protein POM88_030555 [Heracleum sosnowskyi]